MNIDGIEIPIDPEWKRIGISVSGGADSALLTYLIASNTDAEILLTNQIRCWKTRPWQEHIADNVIEWFMHRFDNILGVERNFIPPDLEWGRVGPNIVDEFGKLKSGNQIILRSYNEYISHKYKLDAWFAGINKNPDIDIPGALEDRNLGHVPPIMEYMGCMVCHPFVNVMKDWIVKQYFDLELEDLLEITRSCEGDNTDYPEVFNGLDYTNYTPGQSVPTCGKCFWCKEREWALGKIK